MSIDLIKFGKALIDTKDLDPIYVMLWESGLGGEPLKKWLLAYWCFYHAGTASAIVDRLGNQRGTYWDMMESAAATKVYPRKSERRHFRGDAAEKSVSYLEAVGIEELFAPFVDEREITVAEVMKHVQGWVGFGPWIAFKVADMMDRLNICRVSFDAGAMFLFDSPRKGADLAFELYGNGSKANAQQWAIDYILDNLGDKKAPPRYERTINVQEAETILCKWHSAWRKHYRLGEDITATRESLLAFPMSKTAQHLIKSGKKAKLWYSDDGSDREHDRPIELKGLT